MPEHFVDFKSKDYFLGRLGSLDVERSSFIAHYQETSDFVQPRRGRFSVEDRNKGDKRWGSIINARASLAHRVARSGMLAGVMSPARPWFSLSLMDEAIMEQQDVRTWLSTGEKILRMIFNESNLYSMAPHLIGEMLTFGTGAMLHVDDFDDVARFYTQTAGSYYLSQNHRYEIDTLVREFQMTVQQIVRKFGYPNCSTAVKDAYDKGNYEGWHTLVHFIEPNPSADSRKPENVFKDWRSVYFEKGTDSGEDKSAFLRESGFDAFPAHCPRWDVTGEDVYATDWPAAMALGDIKMLQVEEKRKAQGIDKMVNPPMKGPPGLAQRRISTLPGGMTVYEGNEQNKLEPLYNVRLPIYELRQDIEAIERRIDEIFFKDLFLAITNIEGIQPRNQFDLVQRNEERLLQLGPVLERLHSEFLGPLVERTFDQAVKAGILPPAPPAIEGSELRIDFVSSLAMAQRAVATSSIDRITAYVGGLVGAGFEGVIQKFDADQAVDEYAKAIGVPPRIIRPDEVVAAERQQQQQQAMAQQAVQMGQGAAGIAKTASDTETGESENLLTDIRNSLSG